MAPRRQAHKTDPCLYAEEILGVQWWAKQQEIAQAIIRHKRVLVKASHGVGKSFVAAGLVNWHYDTFNPSITLSTAPTANQVHDVLWKEVRVQRAGRIVGGRSDLLPKEPRMESEASHYAVGFTAESGEAFQGRHQGNIGIIFDEAVGVDTVYWESAEGMMTSPYAWWLAICNPTDTSSRAYEEEFRGNFHVIRVSALEHPNILAELRGEPAPFPFAVRLEWVENAVRNETTLIDASDKQAGDIEWPPGSGRWFRPGAWFESRVLGRWPSQAQASQSVWSEALWDQAQVVVPLPNEPTVMGCDVARFGDDYTSIVVRRGACVIHHETHNGWSTSQTAGRLKELCRRMKQQGEDPRDIVVNVDDDGIGGGVTDQADGFSFAACSGASRANDTERYPNRRSELWFATAQRTAEGGLSLGRLSDESLSLLRRQAMAPRWKLDAQGRRVVEPKADTKKRLARSPDDMDALNLAFAYVPPIRFEWLGVGPESPAPLASSEQQQRLAGEWLCPQCAAMAGESLLRYYGAPKDPHDPHAMVYCIICCRSQVEMGMGALLVGWRERKGDIA